MIGNPLDIYVESLPTFDNRFILDKVRQDLIYFVEAITFAQDKISFMEQYPTLLISKVEFTLLLGLSTTNNPVKLGLVGFDQAT